MTAEIVRKQCRARRRRYWAALQATIPRLYACNNTANRNISNLLKPRDSLDSAYAMLCLRQPLLSGTAGDDTLPISLQQHNKAQHKKPI